MAGSGTPPIVFINGSGGPIAGWYKIFSVLAESSTVVAYNRLGVGHSSKPTKPQTADVVVDTLRELLVTLNLAPPYVLVAHSLGGLHANFFARKYPGEVAGIVLLDATAPDDVEALAEHKGGVQRVMEKLMNAILGKDIHGETTHVATAVQQINDAGPFPSIPLTVISGGKPAMSWLTPAKALQIRAENQVALSKLSPHGKQIVARKSGHFPQFSEPELVIAAVREMVESIVKSG